MEVTIDSKGNIVPKPNGLGRWHSPRRYECAHEDCTNPATILSSVGKAHNCCTEHEE